MSAALRASAGEIDREAPVVQTTARLPEPGLTKWIERRRETSGGSDFRIGRSRNQLSGSGLRKHIGAVEDQLAALVGRSGVAEHLEPLIGRVVAAMVLQRVGQAHALGRIEDDDIGIGADRDGTL